MKQKQLAGAFLLICFAVCLFLEAGSGIWGERLDAVEGKERDTMAEVMLQMRKKDRAQVLTSTRFVQLYLLEMANVSPIP